MRNKKLSKIQRLDIRDRLQLVGAMKMVEILFKLSMILYMVYSIGLHDIGEISDMNIAARMLILSILLFVL